jgi:GDP-4-dehydro-6-deoxy-D-mannose reductase
MVQTALVTGAAGFAGQYMCEYLRSTDRNLRIVSIDMQQNMDCQCDDFYVADITDFEKTKGVIEKEKPDFIIHLAGTFGTGDVQNMYKINILSSTAILEAMRAIIPSAIFIAAGSAAEYGNIEASCLPVTEQHPCRPVMPYGLSKNIATQIAQYYYQVHRLCTMVVRPFQLIGKGVTDRLAPGAFAKRLIEAKKNNAKIISVGNLESSRDFLDIRDAVKGLWLLCENPVPGQVFNLCSGKPVKMGELLELMLSVLEADIRPVTDPSYLRGKSDVSVVYGSFKKIKGHCGWEPQKSLEQSIWEMFE